MTCSDETPSSRGPGDRDLLRTSIESKIELFIPPLSPLQRLEAFLLLLQ